MNPHVSTSDFCQSVAIELDRDPKESGVGRLAAAIAEPGVAPRPTDAQVVDAIESLRPVFEPLKKILDLPKIKCRDSYTGTHRGIAFEISRHDSYAGMGMEQHDCWCYYVYLRQEQVPEAKWPAFFPKPDTDKKTWQQYDWYKTAFSDLPWHGGMTYYHQEQHDGRAIVAKAGCDYDHLWDREAGWPYSERTILPQVVETIDALLEAHSDLLVRCSYTGGYFPGSVMQAWGDGFISPEGLAKKAEYDASRPAGGGQ